MLLQHADADADAYETCDGKAMNVAASDAVPRPRVHVPCAFGATARVEVLSIDSLSVRCSAWVSGVVQRLPHPPDKLDRS